MFPAMDRSRGLASGRPHAALALVLCFGPIIFPGCARMRSSRSAPVPATLGVERPDNNFSSYHTARATTPAAIVDPSASQLAKAEPLTAGTTLTESIALPNLQPGRVEDPEADAESVAATHLVATSQGVPNASRLLAGSAPRAESAPNRAAEAGRLVAEARASLDRAATYQAAMHRQERVGSTLLPAEDLVVSVRREPRAVRLSWPEGPHKGREAIYRSDAGGGLMHVNMADSAFPVPRLALAPDSPMVLRNSRHPITEAGFDSILADLEQALKSPESATVAYGGMATPAPLDRPHACVVRTNAAGEVARVYLDPDTNLPALVEVNAANGDLLEFYVFRDIRTDPPELAQGDAFDQDARWGPARGLFGRVARGGAPADATPPR